MGNVFPTPLPRLYPIWIIPPLETLPPEIASRIFISCLPTFSEREWKQVSVPWTLSQVCRYWRTIAHSTPALWSNITVISDLGTMSGEGKDAERLVALLWRLERQLENVKGAPLDIKLMGPRNPYSPHPIPLSPLCVTILPYLNRSRKLHVGEDKHGCIYLSAKAHLSAHPSFPFLRQLRWDTSYPVFSSDLFQNAPQLRFLHVYGNLSDNEHNLRLPYGQLTEVTLERMKTNKVAEIISYLQNVESLSVITSKHGGDGTPAQSMWNCILPKLRCLALFSVDDLWVIKSECGTYSAPNLQEFKIARLFDDDKLGKLLRFLRKSSCKLTKLVVEDTPVYPPMTLESWLVELHTLTSLELHFHKSETMHILIGLLAQEALQCPKLCPSLRSIQLSSDESHTVTRFNIHPILSLIRGRQQQGLEKVSVWEVPRLIYNEVLPEESWCTVGGLQDEGLDSVTMRFVSSSLVEVPLFLGSEYSLSTLVDQASAGNIMALDITCITTHL